MTTQTRKPGGPRRGKVQNKPPKVLSAKDVSDLLDGGLDGNLLEDETFMAERNWTLDPEIQRRLTELRTERAAKAEKFADLRRRILEAMGQLGREPTMARVLQKIGYAPIRPKWTDSDKTTVKWGGQGLTTYTDAEVLECFNLMLRTKEIVKGTRHGDQGVCLPGREGNDWDRLRENDGRTGAVMVTESPTLGEKSQRVSTRAVCVADEPARHYTCGGKKRNGTPCTAKVPMEGGRCYHHPLEART